MSAWEKLSHVDVSHHIKEKNGLSYLSWAWAWGIAKKICPDANYKVINFDGKPYFADDVLGYMVQTEVTIEGETVPMQLPILDGANKAQRSVDYTYDTKYKKDILVKSATMFDINTAIMRCLTKNLAMFGLAHYIYAGEDLPEAAPEPMIDDTQEKELQALIETKEFDVINFFKAFHASTLADFTHKNAQIAMSKLQQKPNKQNGAE